MTLGQRLKQARLDAGLSQRQLCGGKLTRNMLSQIENGTARPSMDTLQYFATRLGKPISFFLGEETASANQTLIEKARSAYAQGAYEQVLEVLEAYDGPDTAFDQEAKLLYMLAILDKAEAAVFQGRMPYAVTLLERAEEASGIYSGLLQRRRLLLLGQAQPQNSEEIAQKLESNDAELLLRAKAALNSGNPRRCAQLLDAAEHQQEKTWCLLRGEACLAQKDYNQAISYFTRVEDQALARLEQCYEQLGDYKMAYHYACLRRAIGQTGGERI